MSIAIQVVELSWDEWLGEARWAPVPDSPELNLSNSNFSTLWHALGLDCEWCGRVPVDALHDALDLAVPDLIVRAPTAHGGGGASLVDCGIPRSQAERYLFQLWRLVRYAEAGRGLEVSWG